MDLIHFKPLEIKHFPLLNRWLNEPHVKQWYGSQKESTLTAITQKYTSYTQGYKLVDGVKKTIQAMIAYNAEIPFGYIQLYNAFDFPRDGYDLKKYVASEAMLGSIDLFIGDPKFLAKGYGVLLSQQFLQDIAFKKFNKIMVDPDHTNKRAIKCYEKAGFKKVIYIQTDTMTYNILMMIER